LQIFHHFHFYVVVLTELVRKRLSRTITEQFKNENDEIFAITLAPALEHQMTSTLKQESDGLKMALPTDIAMEVCRNVAQAWKKVMDEGKDKVILLCDSRIRSSLAELISRSVSLLPVIAYDEIVLGTNVQAVETISMQKLNEISIKAKEPALV